MDFFKNQLLAFKKIGAGEAGGGVGGGRVGRKKRKERKRREGLAVGAHFLTSRAAFLVLPLLGKHLSISCAIWDGALDSLPQECGQWTMPSFQGLQKGKRSLPDTAHAHLSLLFPASGLPLERRLWCLLGTIKIWSPSQLFLKGPHSSPMLKGTKWKRTPSSHQACAATCS